MVRRTLILKGCMSSTGTSLRMGLSCSAGLAAVLFLADDAVLEAVANDVGLQSTQESNGVAIGAAQVAGLGAEDRQLGLGAPERPVLTIAAVGRLADGIPQPVAVAIAIQQ